MLSSGKNSVHFNNIIYTPGKLLVMDNYINH